MRQKTITLVCDLGQETEAIKTVKIGYGRRFFDLDLCEKHFEEVDEFMTNLANHQPPAGRTRALPISEDTPADIRAWAVENGYDISHAGPIPREVRRAYAER
jgi:Lsr2